mmetsp:Transcript_40613/g.73114  ORF Transcript_40613/g.73114 Transcript_40613/m.73114 type:complete len:246 (+) Transcript_40613:63-800(+)|eukprot:CAMPEP_0197637958 /NCGR_PEP_ID=MMETSP1338-20131121/13022_1 /TAXON_ID=43686 ORGANISM="Pelagodinium beii, Strain RCC1491" /NCGR_SAMPLE_ID=MMETSP1338 /ASSEMBLY_ACC=CAM_ASM_000754 /LENGTH=245 /DNA_ID=CAMNT_0043210455 /DNA_START=63 /DNA_END=800 /DNA_ORIENTATION=-
MIFRLIAGFTLALGVELEIDAHGNRPHIRRHEALIEEDNQATQRSVVRYSYLRLTIEAVRARRGSHSISNFVLRDTAGRELNIASQKNAIVKISNAYGTEENSSKILGAERDDVVIKDGDWILVHMPEPMPVASYEFRTARTANTTDMDPTEWKFEGSSDGKTWTLLSKYIQFATPMERGASVGPFIVGKFLLQAASTPGPPPDAAPVARTPKKTVKVYMPDPQVKTVYQYDQDQTTPPGAPCKD